MSECMSMEDAMNMSNEQAVNILIPLKNMMRDQHGCPISDAYFALEKAIFALRSAQPEIIRCKDCKYGGMKEFEEGYCGGGAIDQEITGMDYCSWAERRTDGASNSSLQR